MVRHGSLYGLAVLICTFAAALLIELVRDKKPRVVASIDGFSEKLTTIFNFPYPAEYISTLLFTSILAFVCWVFF